jgi:hypothetical protein
MGPITDEHKLSYNRNVKLAVQQTRSKYEAAFTYVADLKGRLAQFLDLIGTTTAVINIGRKADTPDIDNSTEPVWVQPVQVVWGKLMEEEDLIKAIMDYQSSFIQSGAAAVTRAGDTVRRDALFGNRRIGQDGGTTSAWAGDTVAVGIGASPTDDTTPTGMNVRKLIRAIRLMQARQVGNAALARENDVDAAALVTLTNDNLERATVPGASDAERAAAVQDQQEAITSRVAAGRIRAEVGAQKWAEFQRGVSIADAQKTIRIDPAHALELLDARGEDGRYQYFHGLDPVTRENLKATAANHGDQLIIDQVDRAANTGDITGAQQMLEEAKPKLQEHSYFRGLTVIDHAAKQNDAALKKAASEAASSERSDNKVLETLKAGIDVPQEDVQRAYNIQAEAAKYGDRAAYNAAREIDLWRQLAPQVRTAYSLPIDMLDNQVERYGAQLFAAGANARPEDRTRYEAFKAVRDEIVRKRTTEPIVLGGENGGKYYTLRPLDPNASDPKNDSNFQAELTRRNAHSVAVTQPRYGATGNVLTEVEAAAMKQRWDNAGPGERFQILEGLGQGLTDRRTYEDTVAAVAGADPLTSYVGKVAQSNPKLAREVLQGMTLLDDSKTREKSLVVKQELANRIGGVIYEDPKLQETAISAALALDASRRAAKGRLYDAADVSGLNQALEEVTGPVAKRNGAKFPITPAIPRAQFLDAIDHLTESDLKMIGGAIDRDGNELTADQMRNAQFKALAIGGNYYAVGLPGNERDGFRPVFDPASGRAKAIDMSYLVGVHTQQQKERALELTPYQEARSRFRAGQFERIRQAREISGTQPPAEPPPLTEPPAPQPQTYPQLEE